MTGAEKAAVLLLYLGPDATSKVFGHMDDGDIKKISQSMSRLGHVPREEISAVVSEFTDITNPETGFFSQEHPQTIAVVLAKLKPKQTSEIVALLPQELQAEVVIRIAEVDQVSPDILAEIDEVIRLELTALGGVQRFKVGGVEKVVDMFAHLDRSREKKILDKLDTMNPPLAEVIRKHLFTFDDIFKLDDRAIQAIMREVSNDTLTLAMKTSTDEVKDKIFRNISSRAAEMIKEDLEVMGPVRLSDVEKAQSEIIKIVRKMEEEGKVVIAGRGADDVLV